MKNISKKRCPVCGHHEVIESIVIMCPRCGLMTKSPVASSEAKRVVATNASAAL